MNPASQNNERQEIYRPQIEFIIDPEKDIQQARWRINANYKGWFDFEKDIDAISDKDEAYEIAAREISDFHDTHKQEIEARVACAKEDWARVEPLFFETVDRLFSNYPWPKPPVERDRYVGFASVLYRFPRYIAGKSFGFPANPLQNSLHSRRVVKVIAHEMLHFMEYEYMEKKFGLQPSEKDSADNLFWQFTENLNVLIENSDQWSEITRGLTSGPYPECQELYDRMKTIWSNSQSVDALLREIFKEQVK